VNGCHEYRCAHNHGEFFIQPVMLASTLRAIRTSEKTAEWRDKLAAIDPTSFTRTTCNGRRPSIIITRLALAGEYCAETSWLRANFFTAHLAPSSNTHQPRHV